jgi:two-component system, chemotaxis family, sensor kinase CheA
MIPIWYLFYILYKDDFLEMFIQESKDHLLAINDELLKMDPKNTTILFEIFHSAHTLKELAGTMGI